MRDKTKKTRSEGKTCDRIKENSCVCWKGKYCISEGGVLDHLQTTFFLGYEMTEWKKNHKQKPTLIMRPSKEWKWQVSWPWKLVSIVSESTYNQQTMRKEFQINSKIQYHKNVCGTHSNIFSLTKMQQWHFSWHTRWQTAQKWPIKPQLTHPPERCQ